MAFKGGADRIELNSALFMGGLTPSLATLKMVKKMIPIPVMAMVRPREGGFCYTELEYETMKADAAILIENGADGLVFGFLNADGTIDEDRTSEFVRLCRAGSCEAVFSRAIDVTPDIISAVKLLAAIGVDRVLTSGGRESAVLGSKTIARMVETAANLQILPGGGVNAGNVAELVRATGVTQVHSSARRLFYDTSVRNNPEIFFGGKINGNALAEDEYKITDPQAVAKMKLAIERI